jgi:hypothetical protein
MRPGKEAVHLSTQLRFVWRYAGRIDVCAMNRAKMKTVDEEFAPET